MSEVKKVPASVYAESTPNPNTMKFVTNLNLLQPGQSVEYGSVEETENSPLAARLFSFPFIAGVFISGNFITLTKNDLVEWQDVFGEIREYITNYLITGHEVFSKTPDHSPTNNETTESNVPNTSAQPVAPEGEKEERIVSILDEYVRPAVESDGGAIEFHNYSEGKLTVVLKGACSGCPSSTATLKNGIQGLFDQMMPEVKEVVALND